MNKLVGILLVALMAFASVAHSQTTRLGDWLYVPNVDLITDENRSLIGAQATTYPTYADKAAIIIRCSDSARFGVDIYFSADKYIGLDDYYRVAYRIDGAEAQQARWETSTSNEAVFAPDVGVAGIMKGLLDRSELVFRISAYSQDYTYVVPISGLREALDHLGCYTGVY